MLGSRAPAFDSQGLLARLDGDRALLAEVLALFTAEAPLALEEIRRSIDTGDAARLERAAHKLRGSLVSLGADPAAEAALALETLGRNGSAAAEEDFLKLDTAIALLIIALNPPHSSSHDEDPDRR